MSILGSSEVKGTYFHPSVIKQVLIWVNGNEQINELLMNVLQVKYRLVQLVTPVKNHMGYKLYHIFNGKSGLNYNGKESGFKPDYYRKDVHDKEINDQQKRWN